MARQKRRDADGRGEVIEITVAQESKQRRSSPEKKRGITKTSQSAGQSALVNYITRRAYGSSHRLDMIPLRLQHRRIRLHRSRVLMTAPASYVTLLAVPSYGPIGFNFFQFFPLRYM